jgi:Flp pilus assembly protein TadG
MGRRWINQLRGEQASSFVELALVLPVLLFLILGVIDLARGYRTYSALATAAHEGARWIVVHPTNVSGAQQAILGEVARVGLSAADITISRTPLKSAYTAGESVTITIIHQYTLMFGAFTQIAAVPFHVQVTMRVLYE